MPAVKTSRSSDFRALLILIALFAAFILVSWQKYIYIYSEQMRGAYVPVQILNGMALYKDIYWFYGPLAPSLQALLYKVFGLHLNVYFINGLAHLLGCILLIYFIGRQFAGAFHSFILAFLFFALQGISTRTHGGTYVALHSFSAVEGVLLSLAMLLAFIRFLKTDSIKWLVMSGIFTGLCFLTKIEYAFAAALTGMGILGLKLLSPGQEGSWKSGRGVKLWAAFFVPAAVLPAAVYIPIILNATLSGFLDPTLGVLRRGRVLFPYGSPESWKYMLWNIIKNLAAICLMIGGAFFLNRIAKTKGLKGFVFAIALLTACLFFGHEVIREDRLLDVKIHRGWFITTLPFLFTVVSVLFYKIVLGIRNGKECSGELFSYLALGIFSLCMALRSFGNYFANIGLLYTFALILWVLIPFKLAEATYVRGISKEIKAILAFVILTYSSYLFVLNAYYYVRFDNYKLRFPRGTMIVDAENGQFFESMIGQISKEVQPPDRYLFAPNHGAHWFYFFFDRAPLSRINYVFESVCRSVIPEVTGIKYILLDEALFNAALAEKDSIYKANGCDEFVRWVRENYQIEKVFEKQWKPVGEPEVKYKFGWYKKKNDNE